MLNSNKFDSMIQIGIEIIEIYMYNQLQNKKKIKAE
jgi:hypothetical protein